MTVAMGKTRKNRHYLKHAGAVCYNDDNALYGYRRETPRKVVASWTYLFVVLADVRLIVEPARGSQEGRRAERSLGSRVFVAADL